MGYFLQQLINGLTLGAIYGLIAIGYTMVYGIIGMINFAHGEIFMIGSFISLISFLLLAQAGLTSPLIAVMIVLVVFIVPVFVQRLLGFTAMQTGIVSATPVEADEIIAVLAQYWPSAWRIGRCAIPTSWRR